MKALPGVESAKFSYLMKLGDIQFESETIKAKKILECIEQIGYEATLPRQHTNDLLNRVREEVREKKAQLIYALALATPVVFLVWILPFVNGIKNFQTQNSLDNGVTLYMFLLAAPSTLIQVFIARPFYASAFRALKKRKINLNFLACMATTLSYGYGVLVLIIGYNSWDTEEDHLHSVEEHAHHFETNSMLITIIVIGNMIEVYSEL